MKLDLPTFGKPVMSRVRVFGSMDGRRDKCCRTSSRYARFFCCRFMIVHILQVPGSSFTFRFGDVRTGRQERRLSSFRQKQNLLLFASALKNIILLCKTCTTTLHQTPWKALHASDAYLSSFFHQECNRLVRGVSVRSSSLPPQGGSFELLASVQRVPILQQSHVILRDTANMKHIIGAQL